MQSAIGRIQLRRMADWHKVRTQNAQNLTDALMPYAGENGILRLPNPDADHHHAFYKYYAFVRPENLPNGVTRDTIIDRLIAQGVPCMQGSCSEIYLEQAFEGTDLRPIQSLPTARMLGETSLMFMVHPGMQKCDIDLS
jgi:dTDP-4-amino-4,6-dideoxygalactose transaminase